MEPGELQKITRSLSNGGELDSFLRKSGGRGHRCDVIGARKSGGSKCHETESSKETFSGLINQSKVIPGNAARERSRVKTLRSAFQDLQKALPSVPADTKLSKLDVLVLATTYIAHLTNTLSDGRTQQESQADWSQALNSHLGSWGECSRGYFHPVKKWPMRSRLYTGMTKPHHLQVVMETTTDSVTMPTSNVIKVEDTCLPSVSEPNCA